MHPIIHTVKYHNCHDISTPDDRSAKRKVYSGTAPARSVLEIENDENVRDYLVEVGGKRKRGTTQVHLEMRETLEDRPDLFSILNGGITIVARHAEVNDAAKRIMLTDPSIINGSQTQGELRRYYETHEEGDTEPSIRYEIIVTDEDDLIADISIARNFQNKVHALSIAGRKGYLDKLETSVKSQFPSFSLRKSESDVDNVEETIDAKLLIQVVWAVIPINMIKKIRPSRAKSKAFTYSSQAACLKLFQDVVEENQNKDADLAHRDLYKCFLDLAPTAWKIYSKWKGHSGFKGTGIRKGIKRDKRNQILGVDKGIIFPILAAHSEFVFHGKSGWDVKLPDPDILSDKDLIDTALQAHKDVAGHNPQTMGKSSACYSMLQQITKVAARQARKQIKFGKL